MTERVLEVVIRIKAVVADDRELGPPIQILLEGMGSGEYNVTPGQEQTFEVEYEGKTTAFEVGVTFFNTFQEAGKVLGREDSPPLEAPPAFELPTRRTLQ